MSKQPFRMLTDHIVEGDPAPQLEIAVVHPEVYRVSGFAPEIYDQTIHFHEGPTTDGLIGVTVEALLAIVVDRLREREHEGCSEEQYQALAYCECALTQLRKDSIRANIEREAERAKVNP